MKENVADNSDMMGSPQKRRRKTTDELEFSRLNLDFPH